MGKPCSVISLLCLLLEMLEREHFLWCFPACAFGVQFYSTEGVIGLRCMKPDAGPAVSRETYIHFELWVIKSVLDNIDIVRDNESIFWVVSLISSCVSPFSRYHISMLNFLNTFIIQEINSTSDNNRGQETVWQHCHCFSNTVLSFYYSYTIILGALYFSFSNIVI